MDILQQHEPSCAKKVKDSMIVRRQQYDFTPSSNFQQQGEFKLPLPPASMVSSAASSSGEVARIPTIKVSSPVDDPPTFAEAIRMAAEVKEEEEEIPEYNLDGYFGSTEEFYHHHTTNAGSNPFLGKRTLGQTYLDLDSRCIAL